MENQDHETRGRKRMTDTAGWEAEQCFGTFRSSSRTAASLTGCPEQGLPEPAWPGRVGGAAQEGT